MLELNVEISVEKLKSEGFRAVRKIKEIKGKKTFLVNTWMYLNNENNEIYLVVEIDRNRVKPIRYFNVSSGETQGYEENRKC